jgi:hypothetical protein
MVFDLTLTFTGIAAFIPNPHYDYNDPKDNQFFVIMPGVEGAKNALDDEPLCPHKSYIEPCLDPKIDLTSLKGKIVSFELIYDQEPTYPTQVLPKILTNLGTLLDKLCRVDDRVLDLESPPRPDFVMTQILLPVGYCDSDSAANWSVDKLGTGTKIPGPIAHEVYVKLTGLKSATAVLTRMDGTGKTTLTLTPEYTNLVSLRFVNTCKEEPEMRKKAKSVRDRDFKWYYELLTPQAKNDIQKVILNGDLPIPKYYEKSNRAATLAEVLTARRLLVAQHDCFPAQMANYQSSLSSSGGGRKSIGPGRPKKQTPGASPRTRSQ